MAIDNCKGCELYDACDGYHPMKLNSEKCPCSICLIKMICNKSCGEFIFFRSQPYIPIKESI